MGRRLLLMAGENLIFNINEKSPRAPFVVRGCDRAVEDGCYLNLGGWFTIGLDTLDWDVKHGRVEKLILLH